MNEFLPVVDGLMLSAELRALLRPGERTQIRSGAWHELPRFFYQIESWELARATKLTAHFTLSELISVDGREAPRLLREFPHYVPCTVSILARYLEEFRERAGAPVYVSVNGGYRSPAHRLAPGGSAHLWAAAADIYRVGDTWVDSEKTIDRYAKIAASIGPEVYVKPFGPGPEETDDHLHLDLGFLRHIPRGADEGAP